MPIPKISEVLENTTPEIDNKLKNQLGYDDLKQHIPFKTLWLNFEEWDDKIHEYLDKCKKLRSEIEVSWKVEGTKQTRSFSYQILRMLEGEKLNFSMSYGSEHNLQEVEHQELRANAIQVVYGNKYSSDPTYQDLTNDDLCRKQIICKEYLKVADEFMNKPLTTEIKQLEIELNKLGTSILKTLWEITERADYAKHRCLRCPLSD